MKLLTKSSLSWAMLIPLVVKGPLACDGIALPVGGADHDLALNDLDSPVLEAGFHSSPDGFFDVGLPEIVGATRHVSGGPRRERRAPDVPGRPRRGLCGPPRRS